MNHPRPDRTDPVDVDNPFLLSPSPPPLTSAPPHAIPSTWSIEKLQNRSSRLIASTLRLPSLGAILDCLLWNSLQAGANKVDVWLDVSGESYAGRGGVAGEVREVRLEVGDDGCGIGRWGLDEVGEWGGDGEEGEEGEGEGGGGDETRGGRSEVCPNEAPAGAGSAGYGSSQFSLLEIITSSTSASPFATAFYPTPNPFVRSHLQRTTDNLTTRTATSQNTQSAHRASLTPHAGGTSSVSQKIIKGGKTLYCGPSKRALSMERGTTVIVRDVYYNVPVRQRTLISSPHAALAQCKRALETIALVHPGVQWNLYERRAKALQGRGEVKHITGSSGTSKSIDVFRNLFGRSGVERVQTIRVSSGSRRIDGFVSLEGSINKSHQHLYINSSPVPQGELQALISKLFAKSRFSAYAADGLDDTAYTGTRKSPRRLERYPIYVLNISLPASDATLSASHSPPARPPSRIGSTAGSITALTSTHLGGHSFDRVKLFVSSVIDEFLQRHGFRSKMPLLPDHSDQVARAASAPIACAPQQVEPQTPAGRVRDATRGSAARISSKDATYKLYEKDGESRPASAPIHSPSFRMSVKQQEGVDMEWQTPRKRRRLDSDEDRSALDAPVQPVAHVPPRPAQSLSYQTPKPRGVSADVAFDTLFSVDTSGRKRYKWIEDIIETVDTGLLPFADHHDDSGYNGAEQDNGGPTKDCNTCSDGGRGILDRHCQSTAKKRNQPDRFFQVPESGTPSSRLTAQSMLRPTDVSFSADAVAMARVIRQVDNKFIACVMRGTRTDNQNGQEPETVDVLVLVDQHAADERVSVEPIFAELCAGFLDDTVETTPLKDTGIVLSREEGEMLQQPGVLPLLARWGIHLDPSAGMGKSDAGDTIQDARSGDYVQVGVQAVPAALKARLGRKDGKEMTRLLKVYLPFLVENMGQVQALLARTASRAAPAGVSGSPTKGDPRADWTAVHRYMPLEMVELVNSKACRNAIMFGDRLTLDQCQRLVAQLGQTRYPFICAHGRPTTVPLCVLPEQDQETVGGARRMVDWERWREGA